MRKRMKLKKRSCSMCKPHKMGHCDKRGVQQLRADDAYKSTFGREP